MCLVIQYSTVDPLLAQRAVELYAIEQAFSRRFSAPLEPCQLIMALHRRQRSHIGPRQYTVYYSRAYCVARGQIRYTVVH